MARTNTPKSTPLTRANTQKSKPKKPKRKLDARPDTLDFRDQMFAPTLIEVPPRIDVDAYLQKQVPVLDQGNQGACTGFGLATVANYLLRQRKQKPDRDPVSARMLYEMARRYDEWPGDKYEGSSARGAMKGWHKHGVCGETLWKQTQLRAVFTPERANDGLHRPLGAYYRVNHKDLVAMHSALTEVGVLYATANVHDGWDEVDARGKIPFRAGAVDGHAFALVAYDEDGFWIQNSWGKDWGRSGLAHVTYDDWLANATDVWVARLGAPVALHTTDSAAGGAVSGSRGARANTYCDLRPHIISLGNDGALRPGGPYGTDAGDVNRIFKDDFRRITASWPKDQPKRLFLYAHGGLVSEESAAQRVAEYRAALLPRHVYPVAFIWHSDFWSTITNILQEAFSRRRSEGFLDAAKDFLLDRLDDALEPLARLLHGPALWSEMKENAQDATTQKSGGARLVAQQVATLMRADRSVELHIAGHSAGSILHAYLLQALTNPKAAGGQGVSVKSCTLWAPACTIGVFEQCYVPAITRGALERLSLFTLTDSAEQDDNCASIYHKSLLYLVSRALEQNARAAGFRDGVPLLGMSKFVTPWNDKHKLFGGGKAEWVRAPNDRPIGARDASRARSHADFDDDRATFEATLARILGTQASCAVPAPLPRTGAARTALRKQLERASTRS